MSNAKKKGSQIERTLANKFWELGFAVVRGGSSGGGVRKRFVPDLVVMRNGKILVLEVKYRSKSSTIAISRERIEKLKDFAQRAGASAYIAIKYAYKDWRFVPLESLEKLSFTQSGYIYLDENKVEQLGLTLKQLIEREFSHSLLLFTKQS
jgi:Holliday junction resolvase